MAIDIETAAQRIGGIIIGWERHMPADVVKGLAQVQDMLQQPVDEIRTACEEYMRWLESDEYHEDRAGNYRNDIFEAAMEAVFGSGIWERHNAAQLRER